MFGSDDENAPCKVSGLPVQLNVFFQSTPQSITTSQRADISYQPMNTGAVVIKLSRRGDSLLASSPDRLLHWE